MNIQAQNNRQFQFQTEFAHVRLRWNPQGQLSELSLYDLADQALTPCDSETGFTQMPKPIRKLAGELADYFNLGHPLSPIDWSDVDQAGWTNFQREVYRAISKIPHGETRTYSWTAVRCGNWGATRAVGQALRKNPIPVLIPCHRVVAVNSLGGFMGISDPDEFEVRLKKRLISIEEEFLNPFFSFVSPHSSQAVS